MDVLGAAYEGDIVNGRMEGHGKYKFADGRVYEGGFKNGELSLSAALQITRYMR